MSFREYHWDYCDVRNIRDCFELGACHAELRARAVKSHMRCEIEKVTMSARGDTVMVGAYAFGSANLLSTLVSRVLQNLAHARRRRWVSGSAAGWYGFVAE